MRPRLKNVRNYRSALSSFPLHCIFCCIRVTSHVSSADSIIVGMFLHTSLSNGSPSKRNWSASLSELPTAMKGPCFTSFSLGLSILLLLLSVSSLGPIVCTWSTQLLLCCSLLSPFLHLALLWPSLPTAAAHSTTELSCQMPLPVSWLFSTFPLEFKGVLYKGELCTKRRIKGNKTKKIYVDRFVKSQYTRFLSRKCHTSSSAVQAHNTVSQYTEA